MPPVLGPVLSSPTRLKSCAGSSATTVEPSDRQNSETSGPSRYSSTTTCGARARQSRAWSMASSRSNVTDDALARGQPVLLHDVRRAEGGERVADLERPSCRPGSARWGRRPTP